MLKLLICLVFNISCGLFIDAAKAAISLLGLAQPKSVKSVKSV